MSRSFRRSGRPSPAGLRYCMRVGIDICRLTDPQDRGGQLHPKPAEAAWPRWTKETRYLLYPYFWDCFAKPVRDLQNYVPPPAQLQATRPPLARGLDQALVVRVQGLQGAASGPGGCHPLHQHHRSLPDAEAAWPSQFTTFPFCASPNGTRRITWPFPWRP